MVFKKLKSAFLVFFLIFSSCGRKNHSIFSFAVQKDEKNIERLLLPVVTDGRVSCLNRRVHFSWLPIDKKQCPEGLIGYALYRVNSYGIVSKKPLRDFIQSLEYFDVLEQDCPHQYLVRLLIKTDKGLLVGPMSKLFSCKKNSLQLRTSWRVGGANNT